MGFQKRFFGFVLLCTPLNNFICKWGYCQPDVAAIVDLLLLTSHLKSN
jgi:hypothetical protein